jgi:hypothetical protein
MDTYSPDYLPPALVKLGVRLEAEVLTETDKPLPLGRFLRETVDRAKHTHKECSICAGFSPESGYWNRVLEGERGIKLSKLAELPPDVQRGFVARWARALGLRILRRADDSGLAKLSELLAARRVRITFEPVSEPEAEAV